MLNNFIKQKYLAIYVKKKKIKTQYIIGYIMYIYVIVYTRKWYVCTVRVYYDFLQLS